MGGVRAALLAAVCVAALGLTGCTKTPTVGDGSLGVDWAVLPTPSVAVPAVGGCTTADSLDQVAGWTLSFLPGTDVACALPHLTETYHVGTFPADVDTDPTTVPTIGTARFRYAYGECVGKAAEFLGGDLQTSRLAVVPVLPSERQWAGMARWFRCELIEVAGLDNRVAGRAGSLHDALAPGSTNAGQGNSIGPLTATCADVTFSDSTANREVVAVSFTSCQSQHDAELVGAYTLPEGDYPSRATIQETQRTECPSAGAAYVGVAVGQLLPAGTQTYTFAADIDEQQWSVGDRSAWCFYGSFARRLTTSVRGLGAYPYA